MKVYSFLLLTSLLSAQIPRGAGEPSEVISIARAVDDHYNHMRSLKNDFVETYRGAGMERTESGTLWLKKSGLKKPGKMRWEYRSPKDKLFLSDGKDVWFYVPDEKQARRSPLKKLDDLRSPLAFLLGKTRLEKELQGLSRAVDVPVADARNIVLRGVPTVLGDRFSSVLLEISPEHRIVAITAQEIDGSTTEYRFTHFQENEVLSDGLFHFDPPNGVEVVDGDFGQ